MSSKEKIVDADGPSRLRRCVETIVNSGEAKLDAAEAKTVKKMCK